MVPSVDIGSLLYRISVFKNIVIKIFFGLTINMEHIMSLRRTLNFEDLDYSIHRSYRFYGSITQLLVGAKFFK